MNFWRHSQGKLNRRDSLLSLPDSCPNNGGHRSAPDPAVDDDEVELIELLVTMQARAGRTGGPQLHSSLVPVLQALDELSEEDYWSAKNQAQAILGVIGENENKGDAYLRLVEAPSAYRM